MSHHVKQRNYFKTKRSRERCCVCRKSKTENQEGQWPDSKCVFSPFSNRHSNGEFGCPDPRSYWRTARWGKHTKIRALVRAHCTAVFARVGMSQWNLLPLKTHLIHLLACKRETNSQFPALPQALVRLCARASGNLGTWRRLCCALNAWWAISVPWYAVLGVFVPVWECLNS